jgi:hypothetical protein
MIVRTTGGWIADHADRRWGIFVSLPVGVVALAAPAPAPA